MQLKVERWGADLALRIPEAIIRENRIGPNSMIEVLFQAAIATTRNADACDEHLEELIARITAENRHDEVVTGPAVGAEVW